MKNSYHSTSYHSIKNTKKTNSSTENVFHKLLNSFFLAIFEEFNTFLIMKTLFTFIYLTIALAVSAQQPVERGLKSINLSSAKAQIEFLASDALKGREAGEPEALITAEYIASLLKEWNIMPLQGKYLHPFYAVQKKHNRYGKWQVQPDSITKYEKAVHRRMDMYNVLGFIEGENTNEYVIVGAHFDHLGIDEKIVGDNIFNGADDNASGVSAVLQIAKAFVKSGQKPKRNIIFAFWDGEEKGLLGSAHFTYTFPAIDKVKAYLNFDMIGRNNKPDEPQYVVFFYTASHPIFEQWVRNDISKYDLKLKPNYRAWKNPVGGSDNGSFAKKNIPILWYHTDWHPDYSQPTDHADRLNWEKIIEITKASFLNAWNLANEENY